MSGFSFIGRLGASKSLLNRALVAQSFTPQLEIKGDSQAEDVRFMREALSAWHEGRELWCGHAGTVLRFLALRVARRPGRHVLRGEKRLFARPQHELLKILGQLGCEAHLSEDRLEIRSWGWKMAGDALHVPTERSSQFASAIVLSAWGLPFDLCIWLGPRAVSTSYLNMTKQLCTKLGMKIEQHQNEMRITKAQIVKVTSYDVEPDLSSLFALAACAAVDGHICISGMPESSLQPDAVFVDLLRVMGVPITHEADRLEVRSGSGFRPIAAELNETPDLFPVLAVLASLADGESFLSGLSQLQYKESDRLMRVRELLQACGRHTELHDDGLKIHGRRSVFRRETLRFDPDQDHRLAFAAAVMRLAGEPIEILHPEVVKKSFPEFWKILG